MQHRYYMQHRYWSHHVVTIRKKRLSGIGNGFINHLDNPSTTTTPPLQATVALTFQPDEATIIYHGQLSNDNNSSSFRLYSFDIPANQDEDISKQKNDKSHYY